MRLLAAIWALTIMAAAPSLAQIGSGDGPIDVYAKRTELLDDRGLSRWVGDVQVFQGDSKLFAEQMDVFFDEGSDGQREIIRIEAHGSVAYITPNEVARADTGIYEAETGLIRLFGNLSLLRSDSRTTVTGDSLYFDPVTGQVRVAASPQAPGERPTEDTRVRATFGSGTDQ